MIAASDAFCGDGRVLLVDGRGEREFLVAGLLEHPRLERALGGVVGLA